MLYQKQMIPYYIYKWCIISFLMAGPQSPVTTWLEMMDPDQEQQHWMPIAKHIDRYHSLQRWSFLASWDAIEPELVSESVSQSVRLLNRLDWCDLGEWRYLLKILLMRLWQLMILRVIMLEVVIGAGHVGWQDGRFWDWHGSRLTWWRWLMILPKFITDGNGTTR